VETFLAEKTKFHKLSHLTKGSVYRSGRKTRNNGRRQNSPGCCCSKIFPGKNNLVIGLGTAITYNFINKYNQFLGGGISPGMELRFKSLNDYTAKLPLIKKDWNFPLVGYDTRTNILSGVIVGMAKEIDGTIDAYLEKYRNFNVVLTGVIVHISPYTLKTRYLPTLIFYIKDFMPLVSTTTNCKKYLTILFISVLIGSQTLAQENSPYSAMVMETSIQPRM
jgi:type III pantothenate kinase